MRSLLLRPLLAILLVLVAGSLAAHAAGIELAKPQTVVNIENAEAAGLLTPDEAALNKIYHIFDIEKVDPRFLVENDRFGKSATPIIAGILNSDRISEPVKQVLQDYCGAEPPSGDRVLYISPSGIFRMNYSTTGSHAVPLADNNSNGVPDFVEWCADYMDFSWATEIDDMGFIPPVLIPGVDYYVNFENMGYYGYTTPLGGGRTRITLHHNFLGFPSNDDPEGNQKGAAKVTCAHEFKHASQYAGSSWFEGTQWVEIDAVWAEEVVYPQVNDYKWYINGYGSPLRNPEQSLDYMTQGGYEDAIWQLYMSGTYSYQIIVDLWQYCADHIGGTMFSKYDAALQMYGSSLDEAWGSWTRWNYLTGTRTVPGFGYDDAAIFYTCFTIANQGQLPVNPVSIPVNHMASRYGRHYNLSGLEGRPKVIIDGDSGVDFYPQAIVKKTDDSIVFYEIELDVDNYGELILNEPFSLISEIGISLPNADWTGDNRWISYDIEQVTTGVDEGIPGHGDMCLHSNFPNPFNPKTTLLFELASESPVTLTVVTPMGRAVRHLASGEFFPAGEHELAFDGKDDAGMDLPSGVYFAQLSIGGTKSQLVKMTLLK